MTTSHMFSRARLTLDIARRRQGVGMKQTVQSMDETVDLSSASFVPRSTPRGQVCGAFLSYKRLEHDEQDSSNL